MPGRAKLPLKVIEPQGSAAAIGCLLPAELQAAPAGHQFPLGVVQLFLGFVLSAASSQRGASAVFHVLAETCQVGLPAPCPNAGRLWMLRLGLYALRSPKERGDDWVWIMDHTLQLGEWKCLVIVGIRLKDWSSDRRPLAHHDLHLLNLTPMQQATGVAVHAQLLDTIQVTGVPRAIVSDGGTELKRGLELLKETQPQVAHSYDIKHKTALLMKHELDADPRWAQFVTQSNQTRLRVTQTALAFLNPPGLKTKARYMNLDVLVDWAGKALCYLDEPRDFPDQPVDRVKLTEKLGWLKDYRDDVDRWSDLLTLAAQGEDYVRKEGYHGRAQGELRRRLLAPGDCDARRRMRARLLRFVGAQSRSAKPDERLIGSSEVLESLIGKYKRLQSTHSKGGMTATLLAFGAIVLDKSAATIHQALTTIRTKDVYAWIKAKLGITIQAQRKRAFEGTKPAHKS